MEIADQSIQKTATLIDSMSQFKSHVVYIGGFNGCSRRGNENAGIHRGVGCERCQGGAAGWCKSYDDDSYKTCLNNYSNDEKVAERNDFSTEKQNSKDTKRKKKTKTTHEYADRHHCFGCSNDKHSHCIYQNDCHNYDDVREILKEECKSETKTPWFQGCLKEVEKLLTFFFSFL